MKSVFLVFCLIFVIIAGFEYGKDPVTRTCWFKGRVPFQGIVDKKSENTLEEKYTRWNYHCPYQNRLTIECSDGKINSNAIIEIWEYDDWPFDNDRLARFNWTKIADDGKSGYVDAYLGTEELTDFAVSPRSELFWQFDNPCSDGQSYKEANMFEQKFVY
uniref:Uncharacterized protein n=1 Tax=Panagrolaimus sp. JU765 TaxID=591449 RepID=A0AC34PZE1_9BILA